MYRVHPCLNSECCYWGGQVKGVGFTQRHGWNSCSEFHHLSFHSVCTKEGQGPISVYLHFLCCTTNEKEWACTCGCMYMCAYVCREMGSGISLQWFYRQIQHHLPRSLFCQDISRKTLCSKFEPWRVFLASYIFTTSLLVWVSLCPMPPPRTHNCKLPLKPPAEHWFLSCVFYLHLLLPQNPAAVVSRLSWGKLKKEVHCNVFVCCHVGQDNKVSSIVKRSQQT